MILHYVYVTLQVFCCVFRSGQVYIASTNHVWRLAPVPITTQIKDLLQNKEFELALQLAVSACIIASSVNVVELALQLGKIACLVGSSVNVFELALQLAESACLVASSVKVFELALQSAESACVFTSSVNVVELALQLECVCIVASSLS